MVHEKSIIWTEKYRPKELKDYCYENSYDMELIKNWIEDFIKEVPGTPAILLLSGKPGIGKTTLANLIFKQYNIECIEINASEERTKKALNHMLSNITKYQISFDGSKARMGLLLDEIDGTSANDKGGLQEIIDYLKSYTKVKCSGVVSLGEKKKTGKKTTENKKKKNEKNDEVFKFPIICTCNSVKNKKISTLINSNLFIKLQKPSHEHCIKLIDIICTNEGFTLSSEEKDSIIKSSYYDYRQIIFNLYNYYLDHLKKVKEENAKPDKKVKKPKIDFFGSGEEVAENDNEKKEDESNDFIIKDDIGENIISRINYFINNIKLNDEFIYKNLLDDNIQYYLNIYTNYHNIIDKLANDKDKFDLFIKHTDNIKHVDKYNSALYTNQDWELMEYITYIGTYCNIIKYKELNQVKNADNIPKNLGENILGLKFHTDYNYMRQEQIGLSSNIIENYSESYCNNIIDLYYKIKLEDLNRDIITGKKRDKKRNTKFAKIKDKIDHF